MKTQLKRLTSDSFIYGLSNTLSKFLGVFLIPIYTRVFMPADYGVIDLIQLSIVIMIILLTCGLDSAIFRFYYDAENEAEKKTIISTILLFVFTIGVIIACSGLFFAKNISDIMFNTDKYSMIITVGLLQIPISLLSAFIFRVLRVKFKAKWYAGISVVGLFLIISLTIYLIVFLKVGIIGIFIARIIGELFQATAGFIITYANYTIKIDFIKLKEFLKFGLPLVPGGLSQWSLVYINRYILLFFTNLKTVGIYAVGYKISSVMLIITGAFQLAWSPFAFSILKEPNAKEIYAKVFKYLLIITISIAAFMTTYAYEIILFVTTPKYIEAYILIGILTVCILTIGIYNVLCIGSTIEKKTLNITNSLIIGTLVNIAFGIILIPRFESIGCALAMLFGYICACILIYKSSQKCYYIPYETKSVLLVTISYIILYFITILYPDFLNPVKIIASVLFYIFLFFFVLNTTERKSIIESIKRRSLLLKIPRLRN